MNLNAILKLETGGFMSPLAGARAAVSGFTGMLKSAIGPLAAITAALAGVATVGAVFKKSIEAAAGDESLTAKLTVLTKSAATAKSLLADLNKFSDDTPFEPEPIMRAGVALVGAKFAAKDVKGLLQDIGDLASGGVGDLSENMNEVASAFARLKSGGSGEALEILRRFSIGIEDLKGRGLKFDAGGAMKSQAEEAIDAVRAIIRERFRGTMAAMAKTTEGLWSTLQGNISAVFREFGKPLLEPLKEALNAAIGYSGVLTQKAQEWGKALGDAGMIGIQMFKGGDLGTAAGLALKIGFGSALNYLVGGLKGIFVASVSVLRDALKAAMAIDGSGVTQFGKGLANIFKGLGGLLGGEITKAMVDALSGVKILGMDLIDPENAKLTKATADSQSQGGASLIAAGGRQLSKAFEGSGDALASSLIAAWDKFTFEVQDTNIIDTSGMTAKLGALVDKAKAALKESRAAAAANVPGIAPETGGALAAAGEKMKGGSKLEDGDRLTKIGLLVGAHQDSLADSSRRTAQNTDRIAAYTLQLINAFGKIIQTNNPMPGAVWAV